jgi:adenylate cyclase
MNEAQHSAEKLARRAIALDSADAEARALLGWVLWTFGDHEGARAEAERALALSPNLARAYGTLGAAFVFSGRPVEGLAALATCIRLDPRDPTLAVRLTHVAIAHYFTGKYEATIDAARQAIRSYPDNPHSYRWLAASLGQMGRAEEARDVLERHIALAPAALEMYVRKRPPYIKPDDHAHLLEGLRKAAWRG